MAENLNSSFKERVARRDGLLVPGAANALAAKIIEDTGFEAIYVTGADVGKSAVYLLSDLASGVTGQILYVDCGYSAMGV